jgi:hypothetical protein
VIGPFNTVFGGMVAKLLYWESVLILGTVFGLLTSATLKGLASTKRRRPFLMAALGGLVMTPPTTVMVWAASRIAFGSGAPMSLLPFGLPVLIVSVAMSLVNALGEERPLEATPPAPEARAPKFLERLPANLRGADIHAVKAEDHYLRVLTSKGSDLILMRLSDAVLELEGLEGARIHRSWWVARAAVGAVSKVDGRKILQLPGGVEAPVSRTFARSLRAESWLD